MGILIVKQNEKPRVSTPEVFRVLVLHVHLLVHAIFSLLFFKEIIKYLYFSRKTFFVNLHLKDFSIQRRNYSKSLHYDFSKIPLILF